MKTILVLAMALSLGLITGCQMSCPNSAIIPKPPADKTQAHGKLGLSDDEIKALRSSSNIELSDALKQRLLKNKSQLKLTPEEMQVLKSTGKVILCGKCGYLLKEKKYKNFETKGIVVKLDKDTGFAKDSIRERIILLNNK